MSVELNDVLLTKYYSGEKEDGQGMWHVWGTGKEHTGFWWGESRERDDLEVLAVGVRIILKGIFNKGVGAWTGLSWLRIGLLR
jgi:hypothetical protein